MALEKILVGDDQIEFARKNFPYIPNTEVEFTTNPDELIKKALSGEYSTIVTDLNYTEQGQEGYKVLEALKQLNSRKILWTGNAYEQGVKDKAQSLGAEVLDKDEMGTLVGQVVNKAPIKKEGKVLVYVTDNGPVLRALEQTTSLFFGRQQVVVSHNLKEELNTGQYGLVIDTSTMMSQNGSPHGTVAHDMKYLKLEQIPRVVTITRIDNVVVDIAKIAGNYLRR